MKKHLLAKNTSGFATPSKPMKKNENFYIFFFFFAKTCFKDIKCQMYLVSEAGCNIGETTIKDECHKT